LLFHSPEIVAALERIEAAPPEERMARIDAARELIDVPGAGPELRAWIRWCLQRITNKATGRVWTQADIGREAGDASGATVSRVFMGELPRGELADKVRAVTARVLGIPGEVIWRPTLCPECGNPLPHGDHDTRNADADRRGAVRWSPRSNRSGTARRPRGAHRARSRASTAGSVDGTAGAEHGAEPTDDREPPVERGERSAGTDDASKDVSSKTHDESGEAGADPQTMT
jgi:hypothetical protein